MTGSKARPDPRAGRLQVQITNLAMNKHVATLSGTVASTYAEPVEGIRYVVTLRDASPASKVIERHEREVDTVIEPGGRGLMQVDIESAQFADKKFRIAITATPVKLGGRAVPPPEGWSARD